MKTALWTAAPFVMALVLTPAALDAKAESGSSLAVRIDEPTPSEAVYRTSGSFTPMATPAKEWTWHRSVDGSVPSGEEQQLLWLMNRARQHPTGEGKWLANTGNAEVDMQLQLWGVDLDLLIDEFAGQADSWVSEPRPPAAFDMRLRAAAEAHSLDLIERRAQDHDGQLAKITEADFYYREARLSVFSYTKDPIHGHAGWNIDWGTDAFGAIGGMQAKRGHRQATMAVDPYRDVESLGPLNLSSVGLAYIEDTQSEPGFGPIVLTGNYAQARWWPWTNQPYDANHDPEAIDSFLENSANTFVVGTVWSDLNDNGLYDPGEGHGGITVSPDNGEYFAVTGDAGGYAFPVGNGRRTVTFSGGPLVEDVVKVVQVEDGDSVLLDLFIDDVAVPEVATVVGTTGFNMDWVAQTGPRYLLEASDNLEDWEMVESYQNSYGEVETAGMDWDFEEDIYYRLKIER